MMGAADNDREIILDALRLSLPEGEDAEVAALLEEYKKAADQCPPMTRVRDLLLAPELATAVERAHIFQGGCVLCRAARESFSEYPHPEPLTLTLYKAEGLGGDAGEAVRRHVDRCFSCRKVAGEDWMSRMEQVVRAGASGLSRAREWFGRSAYLSIHLTETLAYTSRRKPGGRRRYSVRRESGDFIIHLEQDEAGDLRVIILTEDASYVGRDVLLVLTSKDLTLRKVVTLSEMDNYPAAGSTVLGDFTELSSKLTTAELFVVPEPDNVPAA